MTRKKGELSNLIQLLEEYTIEIPIIQRDYVQGHTRNEKIARRFIKDIFKAMEGKGLNLDFIYGKSLNGKFIPLDGQQRLTSLYLTYYYICLRLGEERLNILSRFSYKTRVSSHDFLIFLRESFEELSLGLARGKDKPSYLIRNNLSYFKEWDYDPSIYSMLNMLDIIHEEYLSQDSYKSLDPDSIRKISFVNFYINEHGLSDEIYVKMNARGRQLSNFENFKAKFLSYIEENYEELLSMTFLEISTKLDNDWLNFFFLKGKKISKNKDLSYDDLFMNLIQNIFLNNYYLREFRKSGPKGDYEISEEKLDFYDYELLGFFQEDRELTELSLKKLFSFLIYLESLDLDRIGGDLFRLLENVLTSTSLAYVQRLKLAFCIDLVFMARKGDYDLAKEKHLVRVYLNLVNNTIYNKLEEFLSALDKIDKFIAANIGKDMDLDLSLVEGLAAYESNQIREEREKLALMSKSKIWEELILGAEDFSYFNGRIGVLLNMAKKEDGSYSKKDFLYYYLCLKSIFGSEERSELLNLLRRCLLCLDSEEFFYPVSMGSSGNKSFLKLRHRDASFYRYFRFDEKFYILLKEVFDSLDLTFSTIGREDLSLEDLDRTMDIGVFKIQAKNFIAKYIENNPNPEANPYYYFIADKDFLNVFKNGFQCRYFDSYFIRHYRNRDMKDHILLLNSETTSGYTIEYYSFLLYLTLKERFKGERILYRHSVGRQRYYNLKAVEFLDRNIFISFFISQESVEELPVEYKNLLGKYLVFEKDLSAKGENIFKPYSDRQPYKLVESFKDQDEIVSWIEGI